jgi:hypothetical protein
LQWTTATASRAAAGYASLDEVANGINLWLIQFMNKSEIPFQRLLNLGLVQPAFKTSAEVVHWLGAVQAQDFLGAKWAVGLRLKGATEDVVDTAFTSGELLRTHLLRPTWHFVTRNDIRWLLELSRDRVHAANAYMYRKLELDNAVFKQSKTALLEALQGGHQLTRDQLRGVFHKAGIVTQGELRMGYLLMHAELEGLVCSGPRCGKQFTYALLEERVPEAKSLARKDAFSELARRYFASRGPATVRDFAKWSGLTVTEARNGLESIKSELHSEVLDRESYWFPKPRPGRKLKGPRALLLSIYDEYISGYKDRSDIASAKVSEKLVAQGNALGHVIVIDGQIVGTWTRIFTTRAVTIETSFFRPLSKVEQRAVAAEAKVYGEFFNLPALCFPTAGGDFDTIKCVKARKDEREHTTRATVCPPFRRRQ